MDHYLQILKLSFICFGEEDRSREVSWEEWTTSEAVFFMLPVRVKNFTRPRTKVWRVKFLPGLKNSYQKRVATGTGTKRRYGTTVSTPVAVSCRCASAVLHPRPQRPWASPKSNRNCLGVHKEVASCQYKCCNKDLSPKQIKLNFKEFANNGPLRDG